MVYVTNQKSNTVSVINGNTNNILVGVKLNVNPQGSGNIICDSQTVPNTYIFYDVNSTHNCHAVARNGFAFSSWSNGSSISNMPDTLKFTASDYGISWTANFVPTQIPTEFLYGVVLGPTVGAVLGGFLGWWIPYFMNKRAAKN
jgi:YVTN family beta-propeller protein